MMDGLFFNDYYVRSRFVEIPTYLVIAGLAYGKLAFVGNIRFEMSFGILWSQLHFQYVLTYLPRISGLHFYSFLL